MMPALTWTLMIVGSLCVWCASHYQRRWREGLPPDPRHLVIAITWFVVGMWLLFGGTRMAWEGMGR